VRGNLSYGQVTTPKSGKVRVVKMVDEVARRLARLADRRAEISDEDLVFVAPLGGHLLQRALARIGPGRGLTRRRPPGSGAAGVAVRGRRDARGDVPR
jgi:hypothetical protein